MIQILGSIVLGVALITALLSFWAVWTTTRARGSDVETDRAVPRWYPIEELPRADESAYHRHPLQFHIRYLERRTQRNLRLVFPHSFADAQVIADSFMDSATVIINLQGADKELSKRLIDFASGLTYGLNGSMQRVADKVFLLTPRERPLSARERAEVLEEIEVASGD